MRFQVYFKERGGGSYEYFDIDDAVIKDMTIIDKVIVLAHERAMRMAQLFPFKLDYPRTIMVREYIPPVIDESKRKPGTHDHIIERGYVKPDGLTLRLRRYERKITTIETRYQEEAK